MNKMDYAIAQAKEARRQAYLDAKARTEARDRGEEMLVVDEDGVCKQVPVPANSSNKLSTIVALLAAVLGLVLLGSLFPSAIKGR